MKNTVKISDLFLEVLLDHIVTEADRERTKQLEKNLLNVSGDIKCSLEPYGDDPDYLRDAFFILIPLNLSGSAIKKALRVFHECEDLRNLPARFY